MLIDVNPAGAAHIECEYLDPPSEASGTTTSAVGPGLDSDFGASAGTSQSGRWMETLAVGCLERDLCS